MNRNSRLLILFVCLMPLRWTGNLGGYNLIHRIAGVVFLVCAFIYRSPAQVDSFGYESECFYSSSWLNNKSWK